MISKFQNREKGFTLIELMIVVVVVGILAAVFIPLFMQDKIKAKQSNAVYVITQIYTAEEDHFNNTGNYLDIGKTVGPGGIFIELGISISSSSLYSFTIEMKNDTLKVSGFGNIDDDATEDRWEKIGDNNPINTSNDVAY